MERRPRRFGFLERTAEVFDLPADALAGLPKLELVGDGERTGAADYREDFPDYVGVRRQTCGI